MEGIRNGAGGQVLLIDGLRTKAARRRKTKLGALGGRGSAHFQRGQQMMWQLANWSRRKKLESDLDRELHYHLDRRIIDLERSGLPTEEARRQALLELGGIAQIQEEVRDIWLTRWLRDFVHDLRFSARSIFRSPSFMATAVLSLALGIGATTALYSLIDQIVLRALPVDHPERLVLIDWIGFQYAETFGTSNLMSSPICQDLQQKKDFFEGVLCRAATTISASTGGEPKLTAAELVSGNYFSLLGVRPALGRLLTTDDDQTPGSSPVVVLSYDFWKNQLGGAADIVGRKVLVNQYPMTVVGVAAPAFHGIDVGEVPSLWIPAVMSAQAIPDSPRCSIAARAGCRSSAGSSRTSLCSKRRRDCSPGLNRCWTKICAELTSPEPAPSSAGGFLRPRWNSLPLPRAIRFSGKAFRGPSGSCSLPRRYSWRWLV